MCLLYNSRQVTRDSLTSLFDHVSTALCACHLHIRLRIVVYTWKHLEIHYTTTACVRLWTWEWRTSCQLRELDRSSPVLSKYSFRLLNFSFMGQYLALFLDSESWSTKIKHDQKSDKVTSGVLVGVGFWVSRLEKNTPMFWRFKDLQRTPHNRN